MPDDHVTLTEELKRLRKGRGVHAPNIAARVGPGLRQLCGIRADDGPGVVRDRVSARLRELAGRLPVDLRMALLVQLGLHEVAVQPQLGERLDWLASQIARDTRTARRRADLACERLAEVASAPPLEAAPPESGEGWYVRRFVAIVQLDGNTPEVTETRTVVATRDGVTELDTDFSVPRDPADRRSMHDLGVSLLYGGRLVRRERRSASHFDISVDLPAALEAGQRHEYALRLRVPAGQLVRPHYVYIPRRRCDLFEMRLRFGPERIPRRLWRITESPLRVIDDGESSGEPLLPDASGEIHQVFRGPRLGFAYGVQWNN